MNLTEIEKNVLLVSIDHMEENILELLEEPDLQDGLWQERLEACKTLKAKFK